MTNLDIDIKDLASLGFKFLKVDAVHLLRAAKAAANDSGIDR